MAGFDILALLKRLQSQGGDTSLLGAQAEQSPEQAPAQSESKGLLGSFLPSDPNKREAVSMALLNAGANMMAAGGPSADPKNFLSVLGQGVGGGVSGYQNAMKNNAEIGALGAKKQADQVKLQQALAAQEYAKNIDVSGNTAYSIEELKQQYQMFTAMGEHDIAKSILERIQRLDDKQREKGRLLNADGSYENAPGVVEAETALEHGKASGRVSGEEENRQSDSIRNYQYYVEQEKEAGRTPKSFEEFNLEQKSRGANKATVGGTAIDLDALPVVGLDEKGKPIAEDQEAFLKTLPQSTQNIVKAIAEYRMPIERVTSMRGNERQELAKTVAQYDPTFDMSQYNARANMRKSVTSGNYAMTLNSSNLVIGHLNTLLEAGEALNNSRFPRYNAVTNTYLKETGDGRIKSFKAAADALASELAKVFKGSGASSEKEISEWRENLDPNMSPEQLQASAKTVMDLLASRIETVRTQYQAAMGHPADFTFLTPEARKILEKRGFNPKELDVNMPDSLGQEEEVKTTPTKSNEAEKKGRVMLLGATEEAPAKPEAKNDLVITDDEGVKYRYIGPVNGNKNDPKNWEVLK
ncbi:hypothetical protein JS562_12075 [Agrobacterium sp. S2]|nr:hypothetical protein [Agrobacterium sp. S2]